MLKLTIHAETAEELLTQLAALTHYYHATPNDAPVVPAPVYPGPELQPPKKRGRPKKVETGTDAPDAHAAPPAPAPAPAPVDDLATPPLPPSGGPFLGDEGQEEHYRAATQAVAKLVPSVGSAAIMQYMKSLPYDHRTHGLRGMPLAYLDTFLAGLAALQPVPAA